MHRFAATMVLAALALVAAHSLSLAAAAANQAASVTVQILPQNNSNQTGTATLTSTADNKTKVDIVMTGEPADAQEPEHIHKGPCSKLDPKPAFPLMNLVAGKSSSIVDAPLSAIVSGGLAINVHQSINNLSTYVACGDITPATNTSTQGSSMATPAPMST